MGQMTTLELTPGGWEALWQWVQQRSKAPEEQSQVYWRKHAERSINLAAPGEDLVVCMRGAWSLSGHLEALRMQPRWYQQVNRRQGAAQPSLQDLAASLF